MKRSRHLALLLMGASPLLIGGCDDGGDAVEEVSEAAYTDRAQCVADSNTEADCEKAFVAAENSAAKEHPSFATREECEKEFSAEDCAERVNGEERHWAPHTHGILFRRPIYGYGGGESPPVESHPLYRSHTGALVETAVVAGAAGYAASRYAQHSSSPVTATAHAHTVTRGGFGHTAASHASGSHSSSSHSSSSHSSGSHSSGHSSGG